MAAGLMPLAPAPAAYALLSWAELQSGAHALSASPVGFLSHPMPAEVLVDDGAVCLIRERGTFEHPLTQLP